MKKQTGFVLVSVLIITTITTLLAFSQINENRLQERISGNQQKELNARLAAERGLFEAFAYIKEQNEAGTSNAEIKVELEKSSFPTTDEYSFKSIELDGSTFTLISKGEVNGAIAYLKTEIEAKEATGDSLFNDAVTGCDGVNIVNGTIDSYDSANGPYDSSTAGSNGSVATINSGGDVKLSGSGEVYGNITSNGGISTGSSSGSTIEGDMTAAGDIQLKGVVSTGDIYAGANLILKNLTAESGQEITVKGNITDQGSSIGNSVSVVYGGTSDISGIQSDNVVAPDTAIGECDPFDIPTVMTELVSAMGGTPATDYSSTIAAGSTLNFSESSVSSLDSSDNELATVSPVTLSLPEESVSSGTFEIFGDEVSAYIFNAADMEAKTINISGDITIFVQGDIYTKNTTFNLVGETSSLTILTAGQIDLNANTEIFPENTVNSEGEVPLTIYSSYESNPSGNDDDLALTIGSNGDLYAKVYAPLGDVSLTGGGNIMGAVRGNEVTFNSSAGQIHYDEALSDIKDFTGEDAIPASYSSVYYHYD